MTDLVVLLPDVEQLLSSFLRDQTEVTDIVGDNVFTELPAKFAGWPAVRIHQFNAIPVTQRPLWLTGYQLQVDAFGGPKKTAHNLAVACMGVMAARLPGVHDEAVVSGVDFSGFRSEPDTTFQPARPCVKFIASIFARPNPEVGS